MRMHAVRSQRSLARFFSRFIGKRLGGLLDYFDDQKTIDWCTSLHKRISNIPFSLFRKLLQPSRHCDVFKPTLTNFSESPLHFETSEVAEMLKKVVRHSVATAFARRVLPAVAITGSDQTLI